MVSPLIAGGVELAGAVGGGGAGASAIGAVPAEVAVVEPPALVAVTTASMVEPASLPVRV